MTNEEKTKIDREILGEMVNIAKLEGIDFLSLPKNVQGLMFSCFIKGIRYSAKIIKQKIQI